MRRWSLSKRINDWFQDYPNLGYQLFNLSDFIQVKISYVNVPVNERQKNIIFDIQKDKNITQAELAKKYNVNRETIKRDLKKLRELNLIQRVGSDKAGYWKIINNI